MDKAGDNIETILASDPPLLHKKTWHQMKGWYKATAEQASPPAQVTLDQIMVDLVTLHFQVQPPRETIPISVKPFQVEDLVPTVD